MDENIQYLAEVLVKPEIKKDRTINPMAITGGRMISMEEAGRFANGFDDPARLSAAFAGVAGDIGTNAVAIRGNSPQFTQWRLEGIEIPNPTHFADLSGLGGGFLSALSTQVIGNSDFYNGAFPAEYNNVLSGVFDMHLRNGNNQKYEHAFQVGLMGIDLSSEGPISKKRGSSYLVNYRFSTTSLASGNDLNLKYQDLSFKLNCPTSKAGTFSIWGLGLIDRNKAPIEERSKWETLGDRQSGENRLEKMAGGLAHKYVINENTYVRSSLSATYSKDHTVVDQLADDKLIRVGDIRNSRWDFVFNSYLNTKFSPRHTNRTGVTITNLHYDLDYQVSRYFGLNRPMEQISKGNGESTVFSAYSSSVINLNNNWVTSLGVTAQYFTLNNNLSIEPRVALKWKINPIHSLALAYGLHSRREKLDYYFVEKVVNSEYLLLLNNDTEVITPNWLEEMVMYAQQKRVGCVGAKLLYPDDTIQHAGIGFGIGGVAGHLHKYFPAASDGYMGRLNYVQDVYGDTAACLLIRREIYDEMNGLDESYAVAFNDVDFCVRVREAGYTNVFTPFAQLYHYESKSRGTEDNPEKQKRFQGEVLRFQARWGDLLAAGDPCTNPNFDIQREDFTLKILPLE